MAKVASRLTYAELDERYPDLERRELIDGELVVSPSPGTHHQRVVGRLHMLLLEYARTHGGDVFAAPLDVFFAGNQVFQPDLLFITRNRFDRIEPRFVRGAPDLVIEVSSPSDRPGLVARKQESYASYGVPEHWRVDLDRRRIDVFVLDGARYRLARRAEWGERLDSPCLPGLTLDVAAIIARPEDPTVPQP